MKKILLSRLRITQEKLIEKSRMRMSNKPSQRANIKIRELLNNQDLPWSMMIKLENSSILSLRKEKMIRLSNKMFSPWILIPEKSIEMILRRRSMLRKLSQEILIGMLVLKELSRKILLLEISQELLIALWNAEELLKLYWLLRVNPRSYSNRLWMLSSLEIWTHSLRILWRILSKKIFKKSLLTMISKNGESVPAWSYPVELQLIRRTSTWSSLEIDWWMLKTTRAQLYSCICWARA